VYQLVEKKTLITSNVVRNNVRTPISNLGVMLEKTNNRNNKFWRSNSYNKINQAS